MKETKYIDWIKEGLNKFGEIENWRFKCPKCGNIATVKDFMSIGKDSNTAAQNCIGRFIDGKGCNWAAYGLLGTLDKGRIILMEDGNKINVFEFDEVDIYGNERK